jgi:hypothetical protein
MTSANARRTRIAADLEREASASSRIAVSAAAPGRVTEQGIDAGGVLGWRGGWCSGRPGMRVDPVMGARTGKLAVGAAGRVMAWRIEDMD